MTQPRHAHETENGRYYTIPGLPPLVSVTNAISVGLSKYALPIWYANQSTEAAWDNVPGMVAALRRKPCGIPAPVVFPPPEPQPCGVCRDCLTRHIREAAERARDSASFLGSRVHELAEAHLLGRTLAEQDGDAEAGLYVAQYLRFLDDFDVRLDRDVVAAETTVVNARDGYAGTGDIWLRLPFAGFLFEKDKEGHPVAKIVNDDAKDDPAITGDVPGRHKNQPQTGGDAVVPRKRDAARRATPRNGDRPTGRHPRPERPRPRRGDAAAAVEPLRADSPAVGAARVRPVPAHAGARELATQRMGG